jgi:hypothetical protein
LLTEVFKDYSDIKEGFESIFEAYIIPFKLMRKKDWFSEEERSSLRRCCHQIGILFPKYLKRSRPSKVDDLIFVIPEFADRWLTHGGLRDEDIERLHNETNRILSALCSIRETSIKFRNTMERLELKRSNPLNLEGKSVRRKPC